MTEAERPSGTGLLGSEQTLKERRCEGRFTCLLRILLNKTENAHGQLEGGDICFIGKVVNISRRGVALITRCEYYPGTVLTLGAMMPGLNDGRQLLARVTNLRQRAGGLDWCVGCELVQPLTGDELRLFLAKH